MRSIKRKLKKTWSKYSEEITIGAMVFGAYFAVYLTGYVEGRKALRKKLFKNAIAITIENGDTSDDC